MLDNDVHSGQTLFFFTNDAFIVKKKKDRDKVIKEIP